MSSNLLKRAAAAILVASGLAGCGTGNPSGPVFATAEPVAAAKPSEFGFKHAIRVRRLEGLDETILRNTDVILRAEDFTQSLRQSLANDQMLAPDEAPAEYELTPVFVDLRTAAVSEGATTAQAIIEYRVMRTDGATVFHQRMETEFTSVADPAFSDGGVVNRTLRLVGLGKPEAPPIVANRPGSQAGRGPGPERDVAREVHAARNAIALNIRNVMRRLVVSSPERVVAPAPPIKPAPAKDDTPEWDDEEETDDEEEEDTDSPSADGKPLPPLAPDADSDG